MPKIAYARRKAEYNTTTNRVSSERREPPALTGGGGNRSKRTRNDTLASLAVRKVDNTACETAHNEMRIRYRI